PLQFRVGHGTIRLMRMLPCPHTSSLFALDHIAVCILADIDQCHISFVHFRLFIHHREDPLRAGKRHDNGVKLLCHLHERLGKALCKLKVGSHNTKGDATHSHDGQESSKYRRKYKLQVSNVSDNRSHHVCKGICVCSTVIKFLIQLIKLFFRYALMVENLDDTLSVHPLFHKPGNICDGNLLFQEIFSTVSS